MAPEALRRCCRAAARWTRALAGWVAPRGWPVAAVAIGFTYVALSLGLPPPETVSVIAAESESLSFDVQNPDLATVAIAGLRLLDPEVAAEAHCVAGLLVPALGARVDYRLETAGIVIALANERGSAGRIERQSQPALDLPAEAWLVPAADCPGRQPRRLPIVGPTVLGEELRPATFEGDAKPLINGTITVYGRAIDVDLLFYRTEGTLYPVSDIALPGGSRLFAAPMAGRPVPWHGFVTPGACDEAGCDAFKVQASTAAQTLQLVRPGVGVKPEVISISTFAQLFSDPSIVFLWVLVGVLSLLVQTMADASGLFRRSP